jgi:hypothetical protein
MFVFLMRKREGWVRFLRVRLFGAKNTVEISDGDGVMQVRVTLHSSEINLVVTVVIFALCVSLLLASQGWGERLIWLVLGADSLDDLIKAYIMRGSVTTLKVNSTRLEAKGRSGRDSVTLPWHEISGLQYRESGLFVKGGLLARRGRFRSKLLIPFIDRRETKKITNAIYKRFPWSETVEEKI